LYKNAFSRAALLVKRNWPVFGSVFAYALIMTAVSVLAAPLGYAGGLIAGLVNAACISSFLYLVEMMVRTSKVSWQDFTRSFAVYLGDVIGVMFLLWIFSFLVYPLLATAPQAYLVLTMLKIVIVVFFNAVPELIYLGHHSSLALLVESYNFISNNWIEWFPPTAAAWVVIGAVLAVPATGIALALQYSLAALLIYLAMVMRGLLFAELAGSSRRSRAFRYRAGGS
jgi:hypothetical protein